MSGQHLVILRPARPTFPGDATPAEAELVAAHFDHLEALCREGRCALAGRTQAEATFGVVVLDRMSEAEARDVLGGDPAVAAGVFVAELHPFRIALERGAC